jgi:hypothetical protein
MTVPLQTSQRNEPWVEEQIQELLETFRYRQSLEELFKDLEPN